MNWKYKYMKKFGTEKLMNTMYPFKDNAIKFFKENDINSYNDVYKYCYLNNINASTLIDIPSNEEIQKELDDGILH